jgi:hypothetical protein
MFLFVCKSADIGFQTVCISSSCSVYQIRVQVIFAKEFSYNVEGRAIAQALNRRAVIAEARVLFPAAPPVVCGGQSGTGTGFSSRTSVFPSQFYSTNTAYCEIYLITNRLREIGFSVIATGGGVRIRIYLFLYLTVVPVVQNVWL